MRERLVVREVGARRRATIYEYNVRHNDAGEPRRYGVVGLRAHFMRPGNDAPYRTTLRVRVRVRHSRRRPRWSIHSKHLLHVVMLGQRLQASGSWRARQSHRQI